MKMLVQSIHTGEYFAYTDSAEGPNVSEPLPVEGRDWRSASLTLRTEEPLDVWARELFTDSI